MDGPKTKVVELLLVQYAQLTRNEQVSGSSPLVGSLFSCKTRENKKPSTRTSGALSAVRQQ